MSDCSLWVGGDMLPKMVKFKFKVKMECEMDGQITSVSGVIPALMKKELCWKAEI